MTSAPIRHAKNNRIIGNPPFATDDFGEMVFRCVYTKKIVTSSNSIALGACMPQVQCTYICSPDATKAFKEAKRGFDEMDANCNACVHFERLPHPKEISGLVRGKCAKGNSPKTGYRKKPDGEFWVHPDDHMGVSCWTQRPKKVKD
jgi:hypothetical protein